MSLQKEDMTTRWGQEPHTVEEDNLWTLGSPMTTSKMGNLNTSIVTNMNTWQRNADWKKRNEKCECVLNATRKDISPKTAKESK